MKYPRIRLDSRSIDLQRPLHRSDTPVPSQQLLHIAGFADEALTHVLPAMDSSTPRRTDTPGRSVDQRREALARANAGALQASGA